jgi:drug/metabolite transporter (DMT)-like permease
VVAVWASTFVFTKEAFEEISPLAFAFVRFLGITLLAFVALAVSKQAGDSRWRIRRVDLPRLALVGVCGYTLYQVGFLLGLERTSAFSSSLLISTVPLFTLVLLASSGERPPLGAWVGVVVGLIGTAVFLLDKLGSPGSLAGDVLSLVAAISFAAYGVMNRPLVTRYPTVTYTAYTTVAGAIPLLLISAPAAVAQNWHAVSLGSWLLVGYMIVLPVYVAYMVWNWGISRRGAATASRYALLQPVLTGLLSSLLLGEVFDVPKIIGALLILFGLVALQQPAWLRRLPALQGSVTPSRSRNA